MPPVYHFDAFALDSERRELRCEGAEVPIQPRPLDLLLYLIERRERVVSRNELLDALWSNVQVNDEALGFAVHLARRAVGDDGTRQAVIRTVPRAGFRFVATVSPVADSESRSGFVGRSDVLREVDAALAEAVRGTRSLLLLSGEAGIGKTRTAEMAAAAAREQGFRVYTSRCVEVDGAPVFWPWIQLLRAIVADVPADGLAAVLGAGGPELARLVPELRVTPPGETSQPDAKTARFLLFDSATALVRQAAKETPLFLSIDDLHRADHASMLLLRDLASQLAGARVALLVTHRDGELTRDPALANEIAELVRQEGSRRVALGGLQEEEVGELVRIATGHAPSAGVRADLRERTNGNPFFLHQVIQVLRSERRTHEVESGTLSRLEMPRHSQDAIARQVTSLSAEITAVLEVAAVIGRDFRGRCLEIATESESGQLLSILDVATSAQLIVEDSGSGSHFHFAHVLLRDALYQRIPPERRAQLHLRVGKALLHLEEEEGALADPPTVAHHFFQGARTGDVSQALMISMNAGRWAEERLAFEEAVVSFERALGLSDRAGSIDQDQRCEILLALGDAHTKAGHRSAARDCFMSVARLAKSKELPEKLASAALRFAPDFLAIETGVHDPELVELLEDSLQTLPKRDSTIRARLLGRLAVALHWAPDSEGRRRKLCADAIGIAERLDEPATLRYVHCASKLALYTIDDPERYIRPLGDPGKLVGEDAPTVLLEELLRMTALLQRGRLTEFDQGIEAYARLAKRLRQPQSLWYVDLFRSTLASLEGRFADAEMLARLFFQVGDRVGDKNVTHSLQIQLYLLAIDRGGLERLESPLRQMVEEFPELLGWRSALALFQAELGRSEDAKREIDRVLGLGLATTPKRNEWFAAVGAVGLASAEVGHVQGAKLAYELATPHADDLIVVGYSSYCWGAASLLLGVTAMALGDWRAAESNIRKSVSVHRELGARPALARSRYHEARLQLARGEDEKAREAATEAEALAISLNLSRLAAKVQGLGIDRAS